MKDPQGPDAVTLAVLPSSKSGEAYAAEATVPGPEPSSPRVDQHVGKVLDGRYVVEESIGEGGMGVVYAGRHKVIGKRVAIKILRGDLAADAEMTDRFLNEARSASSIGNPHIVDISDFGRLDDGAAYFVMEYLDGISLAGLMRSLRVVPVPRILHIAKQIARALAAAHERGIVHRDLKPDNVMLIPRGDDNDFVKILDFGIAKVAGEAGRLTRAGSVFGTPHYMSPEQAAGVPVDQRTDIYALGVILYEMASGKVPFDADNFMGILTQHMYKAPVPIRAIVPQPQEVPAGLEAVVLKCLSKKVELRYQTMAEVIRDFEKLEAGLVPDAVPEMMQRSGGFNVPADYFRNANRRGPGGAAMMPGTPTEVARKRSLLMGVFLGASIFLGGIGVVLFFMARQSRANTDLRPDPIASVAASDSAAPSSAPGGIAPNTREVELVAEPIDAIVYVGAQRLGVSPQRITVGDTPVVVRIESAGYKSLTFPIDGTKSRVPVKLEKETVKPATTGKSSLGKTTPPASAAPKPSVAPVPGGRPPNCSIEDWDMFTHKCAAH